MGGSVPCTAASNITSCSLRQIKVAQALKTTSEGGYKRKRPMSAFLLYLQERRPTLRVIWVYEHMYACTEGGGDQYITSL